MMELGQILHYPVLYREVLQACPPDAQYVLDCTFGHAGHARKLLQNFSQIKLYLALDQDPDVVKAFERLDFNGKEKVQLIHANFGNTRSYSKAIICPLDFIILDLGTSMYQLQTAERGFSFLKEGPLDMRMNYQEGISLREWLADATLEAISNVLKEYGEEKFHHRIAQAIVSQNGKLETTIQLADCIEKCLPKSYLRQQKIHGATRSFQAFRILINSELDNLRRALESLLELIRPGGSIAVISFHSLEDRIVKNCFREWERYENPIPGIEKLYKCSLGRCKPRKVIRPGELEISENSASRSARLRIFEKALNA